MTTPPNQRRYPVWYDMILVFMLISSATLTMTYLCYASFCEKEVSVTICGTLGTIFSIAAALVAKGILDVQLTEKNKVS